MSPSDEIQKSACPGIAENYGTDSQIAKEAVTILAEALK
jgi:hypothetical protein